VSTGVYLPIFKTVNGVKSFTTFYLAALLSGIPEACEAATEGFYILIQVCVLMLLW
jgi:hypothetical protein